MTQLLAFWAKLGNATWPDKYHPVACHLIDVAAVTSGLWQLVIRWRFRQWLSGRLGLNEAACGRWLAFWSGAHDIGKVSPCFQDRGKNTAALRERLGEAWFTSAPSDKPQHGWLTTKILADELAQATKWPAIEPSVARNVAVAVGGHHGIFPTRWKDIGSPLGNENWTTARHEMLTVLARLCGVTDQPPPSPIAPEDQSVWMYVAGLTSVADWIGSNQEFFKPVGSAAFLDSSFDLDDYFKRANDQAAKALEKLGWLGRADTTRPVTFAEMFPNIQEPRPLQTAVAEIVDGMTEPSLLIVEAPMGEGKTEAGWYAAACWDRRGGQGAYVALPTMATSNQMFERVGKFLEMNPKKNNLMLQHGKAALNDQFEQLKYAAEQYDEDTRPSAVVAEGWFAANKKHGLLAPYGVGTIDQALLAVLQTKHVFVRLFGLAGKCVILDEVHAYDAYMTTLMERLLRWLAALRCPVVLLSATLPQKKRLKLLRAYAGDELPEPLTQEYPRLTWVPAGGCAEVKHVQAGPPRAPTVALGWLEEADVVAKLRQALANGGCAVVIRNTIGLAQETYRQLRDVLKEDGIEVHLFHARFPFARRKQIEEDVLRRYGRTKDDVVSKKDSVVSAPSRPTKSVLVATQVVEQSLDLDFDVMVSDIAPVDLVLQRVGRLHRHNRESRPAGVEKPRLWLVNSKSEGGLPDFALSGIVYSQYILFRSLFILQTREGKERKTICLPDEIDGMIEAVYGEQEPPVELSDQERAFWIKLRASHDAQSEKDQDEAKRRQIRKPKHTGALARLVEVPREEENPDLHPSHQALTRLTRPTALLICLEAGQSGKFRLIHNQCPVSTLAVRRMAAGGVDDVRLLVQGEVSTAHPGVLRELWAAPRKPKEWTEVGMLSQHHHITFSNGRARVGTYELLLDNELGLQVVRADDQLEDE